MKIGEATRRYEQWAGRRVPVIPADLKHKHDEMRADPFKFLRATYYRWAQIWPEIAGDLSKTPKILSVGDLHVENFGTWRDAEGRLVWGVNDFDEADRLPFANDLTRLCVSVVIAIDRQEIAMATKRASALIVDGYRDGIDSGGAPFVLEEGHRFLREIVQSRLKDADSFWTKLKTQHAAADRLPRPARRMMERLLPDDVTSVRLIHRVAGLGSLGRRRFAAIGELSGGLVAREVKELLPAATVWAAGESTERIRYSELLETAVRCPDPFLVHRGRWVGRRLSPSNARVELASLAATTEMDKVLHSMGFETANIHLGSRNRKRVRRALRGIKASTFADAIRALRKSVMDDWKTWAKRSGR
jgi:uncharacterized protein (DUF2252 family)